MTLSSPNPRRNWLVPLVMLLIGLIAGYFIGRQTMAAQAQLGDCVRGDSTVVASNVSEQSCQATCRTCMWEQNAR
jgi:hypothetical protein